MKNNEEKWKNVKDYEGHYQVSNKGRVKSLKRDKEQILKPRRDKDGYLTVILCKNHKIKYCRIHRLVAQSFIPNPQNLPQVNHKDENPSNNRVENLEWCDARYNNNYGTRIQRITEKNINGKCSKQVLQYTKDGEFVKEWKSTMDVERNLVYNHKNISSCCLGKYKSAYSFVWRYK